MCAEELATANNIKRVIFDVKSVDISLSQPNKLACLDEVRLNYVLPIDSSLTHNWDISATNGVLRRLCILHEYLRRDHQLAGSHIKRHPRLQTLVSGQRIDLSFHHGQDIKMDTTSVITQNWMMALHRRRSIFPCNLAEDVDIAILSDKTSEPQQSSKTWQ